MNHSLPPGTSLPSEAQLQSQFGVSRSVVRQALGALEADGLILRGRGRGSTVAPRKEHHRQVHRTAGLSAQVLSTGASVTTQVLSFSAEDSGPAAAVLGSAQGLFIRRLRSANGVPIAVIHTWLPLPRFGTLEREELTDASLHAVLRRKYGVDIVSGNRQIRAAPSDPQLAAHLGLTSLSPVLLLEGTSFDANGDAVEVFSTWHHPAHVVFDIQIQGDGKASDAPAPDSMSNGADGVSLSARARRLSAELAQIADELARSSTQLSGGA